MAFALKGTGSASTANSVTADQATLVVTTATTAGAAGDLAVLLYAVDNNSTTDVDESAVTAVTDSGGNTWIKAVEFTNGQGTAQTGATCGIWYSNLRAAIATGGTVTLTFSNATSRDASAASLTYYTKAAGFNATLAGTPTTLANDAAAAGSLNLTTANIPCLRIRGIASEALLVTALTPTASFAIVTQAIASTGTAATSMAIRGEWIINTGTGTASAPTGGAGAVDNASVYVAFQETQIALPWNNSTDAGSLVSRNARKATAAVLIAASSGLFLPPQPPPVAPTGWQAPLSSAPPTAQAVHTNYDLPTVPAAVVVVTPPSEIGIPLYSGSAPPRYRRVYFQTRSEPPYLAPAAAATTVEGWQSALSVAPPTASAFHVSYDLPSLAPSAAPTGWATPLSVAPRVAKAVQTWPQAPLNTAQLSVNFTPFGWQGPLETAPRSVKAQAGFASVPYNQTVTVTGWQSPLSVAPSVARAPDNDYSLPLYTAAVVDNTVTLDKWQPALSVAPAVTKAQAGFASVPFNTVQINPDAYTSLYLQPLSVAAPVVKAQPGFSSVPLNTAQLSVNFTPLGWHQALSTAPAVTKAAAYFGSVPLNTAQLSVNFTDLSWAQPLAGAPPVANAQSPDWTLPYAVVNVVNTSWQSALSVAPDVARAQPDFGQLPAYPLQASPVGIAGMAWFTPLWTVPTRNLVAQPGNSSVPFDTTQQIVVTTPGRRRPILFIANVGRLMN